MPKYAVWVKPGSKKGPLIEQGEGNSLIVYIPERAVEGQANDALVKLLANHFKLSKTAVKIISGHASRHKIIETP